MYCSTDIATLVSYSSCVVCLISVYLTTFATMDVCKRYNRCSKCNNADIDETHVSVSRKQEEEDESIDDSEEEYNEDIFICRLLEPFNLSDSDAEQIYLACKSSSSINKKENKDVLLKKVTTLLHWYFNEKEGEEEETDDQIQDEKNETDKKDE